MGNNYVLAIDQGTTATKVLVVDHNIAVKAESNLEVALDNPRPGWVEFDAVSMWDSVKTGLDNVLQQIAADDICGIGVTNQRETIVLWDRKTGRPVAPAISWQCKRSTSLCEKVIATGCLEFVRQKTGLFIDSYYSASKIAWLLEQDPDLRRRCEQGEMAVGNVDCWIIWNLTGGRAHITDVTNASRTLLFNIVEGRWDEELLRIWNIPRAMLPQVKMSAGLFGYTDPSIFGREIPIMGCIGDSQGALFGQCAFEKGMAKNTYGTAANLDVNIGDGFLLSKHRLQTTIAWGLNGKLTYTLEGGVYVAGAIIQWLRDRLGFVRDGAEANNIALQLEDAGGVYFVPAFIGLGAPYWDSYARGMIIGLSNATSKEQIVRAGMEAIAFQVSDVLKAVELDTGERVKSLRADGGVCQSDFLLQFQADISDTEVIRPSVIDTTALGAAFMAGLGCGFWSDTGEIKKLWQADRAFHPVMNEMNRQTHLQGWHKAVERSLAWVEKD